MHTVLEAYVQQANNVSDVRTLASLSHAFMLAVVLAK
jgi:hypothetical protein